MSEEEEPKAVQDPREPEPKGTDYVKAGQSKKQRKKDVAEGQAKKEIKKIVKEDVIVEKRGVGSKIKDLFVAADLRSVVGYVAYEIFIPAARNMIVDGAARGVERLIYGETRFSRPRGGGPGERSRITYNTPPNRGLDPRDRGVFRDPRTSPPDRSRYPRQDRNDYIFHSREDADNVLGEMYDVLNVFECVSVQEYNTMIGIPSSHTDTNYGWTDLRGVEVRQIRDGWMLDLPAPEPL